MATIEKRNGNIVHFTMEIPAKDFSEAVQKAYLKNRKNIVFPGFRKGKVPRQIIEKNYGKDVFYPDAVDDIVSKRFVDDVREMDIIPLDLPKIEEDFEVEADKPIILKATVEVAPEIELKKYKGLEVEKPDYKVNDELVDKEIEKARDKNARIIDAGERPVKNGDLLNIDFEGFIGDEPFEGGKAVGTSLEIGSGTFIPGFEDGLIGKNKGETVDVEVVFPEDYHEETLSGKPAKFVVKINEIREKKLPELDDEFVKDVSEYDTLDEYKAHIRESLEKEFEEKEILDTDSAILKALIEENDFEVPPTMLRNQVNEELKDFSYRLKLQGMTLESYMGLFNLNIEMLKKQLEVGALVHVKEEMLLYHISKLEKIVVTDEDIEKELDIAVKDTEEEGKEEQKKRILGSNKEFFRDKLKLKKAFEVVKDSVIFTKKKSEEE